MVTQINPSTDFSDRRIKFSLVREIASPFVIHFASSRQGKEFVTAAKVIENQQGLLDLRRL
jgi:hypothetical protein